MIAVAVGNDAQFAKFAALLGKAEWAKDARYATNPDRVTNRDSLDEAITAILNTRGAQDWLERLTAAGIPCGKINSVAEALASPHADAREMVRTVQHPTAGEVRPSAFHSASATRRHRSAVRRQHWGSTPERSFAIC